MTRRQKIVGAVIVVLILGALLLAMCLPHRTPQPTAAVVNTVLTPLRTEPPATTRPTPTTKPKAKAKKRPPTPSSTLPFTP